MLSFRTHLTVLQSTADRFPSTPVFRLPSVSPSTGLVESWIPVTYKQFLDDVELMSKYWAKTLHSRRIPRESVVGLWLGGLKYIDVVQIYAVSRAGYVPQLFSLRLPNPDVVYELLSRAGARALIHDSSFTEIVQNPPVPTFVATELESIDNYAALPMPPYPSARSPESLVFVFHTSGSTSGSPKLVPCSYAWVDSMVSKSGQVCTPKDNSRQDVSSWMGSMCHIGQTFMLLGALQHGSCTIQPTRIDFSSDELVDMIRRCQLNRLNQFATFLGRHIRHSRNNPKLLAYVQSLDQVLYSGLPLPREEEEYAYKSNIRLVNLFGSTECGAMLLSVGGNTPEARLFRPLQGVHYSFMPITSSTPESGHVSASSRMLELVILSDSPDCPDPSLRKADGHFHTGDLFQQVQRGMYLFRGRDDDWIKTRTSLRCDTRAIEDNVRATCSDLVSQCIVVGTGRPSPALFVEPASVDMDHITLRKEIIRRTRQFHARRYVHERITSADFVIVVAPNTLPRTATKGNIRRQAVEETFRDHLDILFGMDSPQ